ncbi:MAG: sigma-70 family RNA polymerase sigma factor [Dehalococcoidia bacterium]
MEYAALSDETLATSFVAGDQAAFEALVTRYARPLYNFAFRFVGNGDDANDVAQSTFLQAYTHLARVRLDQALKPWLFQVARNKAIDVLRARRQVVFSQLERDEEDLSPIEQIPDREPLPEDLTERADLQRILAEAIGGLAPKYREVVALRYTDLTFKEMEATACRPSRPCFQRAKVRHRAALGELAD